MTRSIAHGDTLEKNKRKPISKTKRKKIFEQSGSLCFYCGEMISEKLFHIDHKIPVRYGGSNDLENLVASCIPCHKRKTSQDGSINPYKKRKNVYDNTEEVIGEGAEIIESNPSTGYYGGRSWFAL